MSLSLLGLAMRTSLLTPFKLSGIGGAPSIATSAVMLPKECETTASNGPSAWPRATIALAQSMRDALRPWLRPCAGRSTMSVVKPERRISSAMAAMKEASLVHPCTRRTVPRE